MNALALALAAVKERLDSLDRPFAVVGGLAVSARTEPRFTRDVDLAVAVAGDPEAEALTRDLVASGYRILATVEQEATHRLATLRLAAPGATGRGVVVDLLFASSGIEGEITRQAELLELFPSLRVPVARVEHLVALKVLARDDARRPQDRQDLLALLRVASVDERDRARRLLEFIAARGFARGRELGEALDQAVAESTQA